MSSIIHDVEGERKMFTNNRRGFLDEITYHLITHNNFSRSEFEDKMVTIMLNSVSWGTIMKQFMKLVRHKKMVMNRK